MQCYLDGGFLHHFLHLFLLHNAAFGRSPDVESGVGKSFSSFLHQNDCLSNRSGKGKDGDFFVAFEDQFGHSFEIDGDWSRVSDVDFVFKGLQMEGLD